MAKKLLIVFAKNRLFGKVKTRLAQTIGDQAAFTVYERLFEITERESLRVEEADVWVFYSHEIDPTAWKDCPKFVQHGVDLGARMKNAFEQGFEQGYEQIIGIGADLAEISAERIEIAFEKLAGHDFVFGPAADGGYYLVGLTSQKGEYVFEDKPWSTDRLFLLTQREIYEKDGDLVVLEELNDIDTIEDLERSVLATEFADLIAKAKAG